MPEAGGLRVGLGPESPRMAWRNERRILTAYAIVHETIIVSDPRERGIGSGGELLSQGVHEIIQLLPRLSSGQVGDLLERAARVRHDPGAANHRDVVAARRERE